MAVSSDTMVFGAIEETSPGVIPDTPNLEELRITGESVVFAPTSTTSDELSGASRGVRDSILTGGEVSGGIDFELSRNPGFEMLLEGLFGSDWGDAVGGLPGDDSTLYVDTELKTYTLEKKWDMGENAPDPLLYHRYTGNVMNTMSINITPNAVIDGSWGVLGSELVLDDAEISGVVPQPAPTTPVMRAPLVSRILLQDSNYQTIFDVGTYCWTNLVMNFNNNARTIACIGSLGSRETVLGRMEITIDYSIYFNSNEMLQRFIDQDSLVLLVEMEDDLLNSYQFFFDRVKITNASVNATGSGEDVVVSGTFSALLGGPSYPGSPAVIFRNPAAPVVASTGMGATVDVGLNFQASPVQILIGGGTAKSDGILRINTLTDSGLNGVFTVPIATGDTEEDIATNAAALIDSDAYLAASAAANVLTLTADSGATTLAITRLDAS